MKMNNKTPYISLFSGAMGLDIGLERAGYYPLICNEIDKLAVETIKENRPNLPIFDDSVTNLTKDRIEQICSNDVENIELLAGGPPCQAFSVFGQRKGVFDTRGNLLLEFIRLVSEVQPKVFLMENVRGLHSMPLIPKKVAKENEISDQEKTARGSLLNEVLRRFHEVGYRVDCFLVNSVNYGAPQIRERLICIGNRFGAEAKFPEPQFSNRPDDGLPPFKTLGDVIGDGFNDPDPSIMNFSPRKLKYLSMVPPGGNWRNLPVEIQKESMGKSYFLKGGRSAYWRRLSFDYPSPTVVTMPNHAGTSMCHPQEIRALTVGELAAVQEFPSEWRFLGSPTDKCRQIGNAVPTRLGEVAGGVIRELLKNIQEQNYEPNMEHKIIHIRPHVRTRSYYRNGKAVDGTECYYNQEVFQEKLKL